MAADGEYDVQISGGNGATQQYRVRLDTLGQSADSLRSDLAATTGAGLVGLDDDLTYADGTVGAKAQYAQTASAQAQAMLSKISRNVEDVTILALGDSTGNGTDRWVYRLATALPAMFPAHTIYYAPWNSTVYDAPTLIATGTGAQSITVYNGAISGSHTISPLGGRWAAMVAGVPAPDLTFINYGHNEGTLATGWRADMLALTESLTEEHPSTGVVLILQNPATTDTKQAERQSVYSQIAANKGYGTINIWQAFVDYGPTWTTDLMEDTVHPNSAGSILWMQQVQAAMQFSRYQAPRPRTVSGFTLAGTQLAQNGDFSSWTGTVPDGWVVVNGSPTITRDVTNYESPNGYSVNIQAAGGVTCSLGQELPLAACKGKWVTVAARVWVPIGSTVNAGLIGLSDGSTNVLSDGNGYGTDPGGAFKWVVVCRKISTSATMARVGLYGDLRTTNGNASFDRVSVVIGDVPLGLPYANKSQVAYTPIPGGLAATVQRTTKLTGQAYPSFFQTADGAMWFGSGTAPAPAKGWYYSGGNIKSDLGIIVTGATTFSNTVTITYALISLRGIQVQGKAFTANGATTTFTYPVDKTYQYITTSAASLATTLPDTTAAKDGLIITLVAGSAVATATWVAGTGGATIVGAPAALVANTPVRMIYHHATTSWYPY